MRCASCILCIRIDDAENRWHTRIKYPNPFLANTCQQFGKRKRFHQVIIRAGIQSGDAIGELIPGGEDDDGRGVAGSAALGADFNGSLSGITLAGTRLTIANNTTVDDNVTTNNAFVIRVRLIADNVIGNQANTSLQNSAQIVYSDPDGGTANGNTPVDRTVALSGGRPTVTVREPTLNIAQSFTTSNPSGSVERDDTVTYTITISNNNAGSDFNAFDISFSNNLPFELDFGDPGLGLQPVVYAGGATANSGADFVLTGRGLTTASGANIDIPKGAASR